MAGACGGAKNGDLMYVISRDRPGMCISPVITHSRAHMHFTFPITGETCSRQDVNVLRAVVGFDRGPGREARFDALTALDGFDTWHRRMFDEYLP